MFSKGTALSSVVFSEMIFGQKPTKYGELFLTGIGLYLINPLSTTDL